MVARPTPIDEKGGFLSPDRLYITSRTIGGSRERCEDSQERDATRVGKTVVRKGGSESWRITSAGKVRKVTTRRASVKAMDEALVIYDGALRRLADR